MHPGRQDWVPLLMSERNVQIERFLKVNGQGRALRGPLAGDASARRYERLRGGLCPAVLMDAPPDLLDVEPFVRIGRWLRKEDFSAPLIFAADLEAGLVLMEDLGNDLFSVVLKPDGAGRQVDAADLYGAAIDALIALQRRAPPDGLPAYDREKMLAEVALLTEWYAPSLSQAAKQNFLGIWQELLPATRTGPDTFVYVDYHADNLLWLPEREGLARVGLLDFQDGRLGPPAYDLVSLLEDARRNVPPDLALAMIERYLAAQPDLDSEEFRTAYALLGAQRNCKILGLFSRLAKRDSKTSYLALQDRVRGHLQRDLDHPRLATLAAWFDSHIELNIAS